MAIITGKKVAKIEEVEKKKKKKIMNKKVLLNSQRFPMFRCILFG